MKKIISGLIILCFFANFLFFTAEVVHADENCFVVTGYYSPLPNQDYYFKGSYEADIKLNGSGIFGASGKPVFSGMLAAPKKYYFGQKIFLEGIGVGEVADRGGAIVSTDISESRGYEYDRIDIWLGYGEEGLKRALTWGKRTICNSYVLDDDSSEVTLNILDFPAPNSALARLEKAPINIFQREIGVKSSENEVAELHKFLSELGLYSGVIQSKYNKETVKAVYKFQLNNKIVTSPKNNGAGLWGEQTRIVAKDIDNKKKELVKKETEAKMKNSIVSNTIKEELLPVLSMNIGIESSSEDIKKLQDFFAKIGIYKGEINGNFSDIEKVLITYQIQKGLIKDKNSYGAGYFGPKTRAKAKSDYLSYQEQQNNKEKKMNNIQLVVEKKVNTHISSIGVPKEGDTGEQVRLLQKTLKLFGYYKVKDNAIFDTNTKLSLIQYQIDKGIIKTKEDYGAGYYGPKTKQTLKNELFTMLSKQAINELNSYVYTPVK